MIRLLPLLVAWLLVTPVAQGQSVYKCVSPAGVTYQGSPCNGGPTTNAPASAVVPIPRMANAPHCNARPLQVSQSAPWKPRSLCIGITDDEVLNLAGWGRPSTIARVRGPRGWQEQWTYESRATGSRRLEFVNGKLASVETPVADDHLSMRVPVAYLTHPD